MTDALPGLEPGSESRTTPVASPRRVAGYEIEDELRAAGAVHIAGVDEVGRGAWAGPVVVCAAVTAFGPPPELPGRGERTIKLTDSKLLGPAQREAFAAVLPEWLICHAYGESSPEEIDEAGMTEALRRAACRALEALPLRPDVVLLDGAHDFLGQAVAGAVRGQGRPALGVGGHRVGAGQGAPRPHDGGDRRGAPGVRLRRQRGLPLPVHQQALAETGPTPHHRLSWSYLDDLPQWRHLRKHRDPLAGSGQMTLL